MICAVCGNHLAAIWHCDHEPDCAAWRSGAPCRCDLTVCEKHCRVCDELEREAAG